MELWWKPECTKCHGKLYKYFQLKHQIQVKNGAFNGEIYKADSNQNCCCQCFRKDQI